MANTNTSTQKGTKKGGVKGPALDMTFLNSISSFIHEQLKTNFTTLGANPNSFATILGIIGTETGRNISPASIKIKHIVTTKNSGTGSVYWNHTVIKNARKKLGDGNANLLQGLQAHSLMAVMGWNNIRGLDDKFPYLLKQYKTLAEANGLIVEAGANIDAIYTPDLAGAQKAIMAGLMILESKYKSFLNKKLSPTRALVAATRAYLGIGVDQTGTSTTKYFGLVTSLGLRLAQLVITGKVLGKIVTPLSPKAKSPVQTTTSLRSSKPNLADAVGQANYIPPGSASGINISADIARAAGLTPNYVATVPSFPNIHDPVPPFPNVQDTGFKDVSPGMRPIAGMGSPTGTVNGASADEAGILNTVNTAVNRIIMYSKGILNQSGIPGYALNTAIPKPPFSYLNTDSTLKNVAGVTFPVGGDKPVGPIPEVTVVNPITGQVVSGGSLITDQATLIAAIQMPVGVIETKPSEVAVEAPISNATPVPQPGC